MGESRPYSDDRTTIKQLRDRVTAFINEREWSKYHNARNLAVSISIEAAELLEVFQWQNEKETNKLLKNPIKYEQLKDELADVVIYCLSLANTSDIDISQAIIDKINKNEHKYPINRVKGSYKKYTEL